MFLGLQTQSCLRAEMSYSFIKGLCRGFLQIFEHPKDILVIANLKNNSPFLLKIAILEH